MKKYILIFISFLPFAAHSLDTLNYYIKVNNFLIFDSTDTYEEKVIHTAQYNMNVTVFQKKNKLHVAIKDIDQLEVYKESLTNSLLNALTENQVEIIINKNNYETKIKMLGAALAHGEGIDYSTKCITGPLFCSPCKDYIESLLLEEIYFLYPFIFSASEKPIIRNYSNNIDLPLTYTFEKTHLDSSQTKVIYKADQTTLRNYYEDILYEYYRYEDDERERDYIESLKTWEKFKQRQRETGEYYSDTQEEFINSLMKSKDANRKQQFDIQYNYLDRKIKNAKKKNIVMDITHDDSGRSNYINLIIEKAASHVYFISEPGDRRVHKLIELIEQ